MLRLPKHRLYCNEKDAMENLKKNMSAQKRKTPYDYMI